MQSTTTASSPTSSGKPRGNKAAPTPYKRAGSWQVKAFLLAYLLAWPATVLGGTALWIYTPWAGLLFAATIGLHVNLQLGFLYHELWHKVFFRSSKLNNFFYWLISIYHFSGPQTYGLAHATHHRDVHTYNDLEFWPGGKCRSVARARIGLIFELFFGIIAWTFRVLPSIKNHEKFNRRDGVLFVLGWLVMFTTLLLVSRAIFGDDWWWAAIAYWVNHLFFSVTLRMLQYLEHLGINAPDLDYQTRVKLTRNVRHRGLINRLWHKVTLNETVEHTLHHQRAGIPYRNYSPLVAPPKASAEVRTVSITALPGIIYQYWKDPFREIGPDSPDLAEIPGAK